jgi:hypothetical protein
MLHEDAGVGGYRSSLGEARQVGAGEGLSSGERQRARLLGGPGAVVAGQALIEGIALGGR